MKQLLTTLALAGIAYAQGGMPLTSMGKNQSSLGQPTASVSVRADLGALPSAPGGKASLIGGTLHDLDPVRDRIQLQSFGGGKTTVLFDERTAVYLNGQKVPLRNLSEGQHIYAETVLEKSDVFARSIHITTSHAAEQSSGQVMSFDPKSGDLLLRDAFFPRPVRLRLEAGTPVMRGEHQADSSQLQPGTLIAVEFDLIAGHEPVAKRISILAQPGSAFVFPGQVRFLDLHTHSLVLSDPRDNKSYEVYCDPATVAFPSDLREGSYVTVTANFDGTHYAATAIALNSTPAK